MMDFHAHMNMNEVIGLLAGECHEDRRLIRSTSSDVLCIYSRHRAFTHERYGVVPKLHALPATSDHPRSHPQACRLQYSLPGM